MKATVVCGFLFVVGTLAVVNCAVVEKNATLVDELNKPALIHEELPLNKSNSSSIVLPKPLTGVRQSRSRTETPGNRCNLDDDCDVGRYCSSFKYCQSRDRP